MFRKIKPIQYSFIVILLLLLLLLMYTADYDWILRYWRCNSAIRVSLGCTVNVISWCSFFFFFYCRPRITLHTYNMRRYTERSEFRVAIKRQFLTILYNMKLYDHTVWVWNKMLRFDRNYRVEIHIFLLLATHLTVYYSTAVSYSISINFNWSAK